MPSVCVHRHDRPSETAIHQVADDDGFAVAAATANQGDRVWFEQVIRFRIVMTTGFEQVRRPVRFWRAGGFQMKGGYRGGADDRSSSGRSQLEGETVGVMEIWWT